MIHLNKISYPSVLRNFFDTLITLVKFQRFKCTLKNKGAVCKNPNQVHQWAEKMFRSQEERGD